MKCVLCDTYLVFGNHQCSKGGPTTIMGEGVAHQLCAEMMEYTRRIFKSISIKKLSETDLMKLRDMVCEEINERTGLSDDSIEFF